MSGKYDFIKGLKGHLIRIFYVIFTYFLYRITLKLHEQCQNFRKASQNKVTGSCVDLKILPGPESSRKLYGTRTRKKLSILQGISIFSNV